MRLEDRIDPTLKLPQNFYTDIAHYKEILKKWNRIHNLTGAKDEETIDAFIADAVGGVAVLKEYANRVNSVVDIGSGAGFPGMILAIAMPQTSFTLVEPLNKRASFLSFCVATIGLKNVTVLKQRAEDVKPFAYDVVTSRAVTDTKMLLKLSEHLRDSDSILLFYKGENVYNEVDKTMNHKIIKQNSRHYLIIGENI